MGLITNYAQKCNTFDKLCPLTIPLNGNRFFHGLFQSVIGFLVMDSNFNCILHHQTKLKWTLTNKTRSEKLTWEIQAVKLVLTKKIIEYHHL